MLTFAAFAASAASAAFAAFAARPVGRHLQLALLTLLITGVLTAPAAAQGADPQLPLFDAHLHYSHDAWERLPPAQAVALLRQAGVKRAMVSSSSDAGTQMLYQAAPDLVLPGFNTQGRGLQADAVRRHRRIQPARSRALWRRRMPGAGETLDGRGLSGSRSAGPVRYRPPGGHRRGHSARPG